MNPTRQSKAEQYISDVLSGRIITSKWVRQTIERHQRDLKDGPARGLKFDSARGHRVIEFIERFIPGTEGEHDDKPFILEPWAAGLVYILYGWIWEVTGFRRFKFAYAEIGRGNLKSTLASALCIYELISEAGANVYTAATDRATAKVVFDTAALMVRKSPPLAKRIRNYRNNLHIPGTASKFEPCSSEAKTIFSHSRPSFVVLDELHAHATDEVWNAFASALGKRAQPMLFAITNSGFDRHSVCWRQREYSVKVLDGIIPDDTWFSFICGLDEGDDWEDERNWIKANPSLGCAVSTADMRSQALKAKADPTALNSFKRFRLSIWTESAVGLIPMAEWALCNSPVDMDSLKGQPCFGGLDLSTTTDISAFVLLFPPYGDRAEWVVLPHFFLPQDNIQKRCKRDRVPYDIWERQGLFHLTPGNIIDYAAVRAKIVELSEVYDLREISFDPWNAAETATWLQDNGFTVSPVRQGFQTLAGPTKRLLELILKHDLAHLDNPVLRWMASNIVADMDATGSVKPDKAKSAEKIDGISALICALSRAMVVTIAPKKTSFAPFFV